MDEIAALLNIGYKATQSRLSRAGIKPSAVRRQKNVKSRSLYKKEDILKIMVDNRLAYQKISLEPVEVYYIYESKMNNI